MSSIRKATVYETTSIFTVTHPEIAYFSSLNESDTTPPTLFDLHTVRDIQSEQFVYWVLFFVFFLPPLTQNQVVSRHFPGQVVGQVDGVHVDVLVAVLAHRLDHLPSDLIARLLPTYGRRAHEPRGPTDCLHLMKSAQSLLTFLHTAMRVMMDMIIMDTSVRTAANKAALENRAATGQKRSW